MYAIITVPVVAGILWGTINMARQRLPQIKAALRGELGRAKGWRT